MERRVPVLESSRTMAIAMSPFRSRKLVRIFLCTLLAALFFFETHNFMLCSSLRSHLDQSGSAVINATSQKTSTKPVQFGKHRYRPDGLLEVNEEGIHPIYELISLSEKEWAEKNQRASKTLREAVTEYKRRYKRPPPKGFDLWWKYAKENGVQLPDEYDQIYNDLEGFYGIEPADLMKIHEENEVKKDTYTIGKTDSSNVDIVTYAFTEGRYDHLIVGAKAIVKTFEDIQEYLPPFRMTFSPHDPPNRMSDYGVKKAALEAAAKQTYLSRTMLPKIKRLGWVSACSPDSPARQMAIDLDNPPPPAVRKSFIYDHPLSMDPCNHPGLLYRHGQFLSHDMGPTPQAVLVPEFSSCSTTLHHNIRYPVPYAWVEDIYPRSDDPDFASKPDERLLWRGTTTGMHRGEKSRWKRSHRDFLVAYANELEGTIEVLPPNRTRSEQIDELHEMRKAMINPAALDIAFAGEPLSCSPSVCEEMKKMYPFRNFQSVQDAGRYKYIIDVDGNGWSGRFKRLMTSNALIFKATIYPEWYADRIAPWVHYVPIQVDLSDLHDALLFFRGDGNGEGAHENLAHKIAVAGRRWSKSFWRKEDMASYLFRLTLEYARLMSTDKEFMSYLGSGSEEPL